MSSSNATNKNVFAIIREIRSSLATLESLARSGHAPIARAPKPPPIELLEWAKTQQTPWSLADAASALDAPKTRVQRAIQAACRRGKIGMSGNRKSARYKVRS